MEPKTDRTHDVEQRLAAIHVGVNDVCCFWKAQENTTIGIRSCWHCQYAAFNLNDISLDAQGLCKFKKGGTYR